MFSRAGIHAGALIFCGYHRVVGLAEGEAVAMPEVEPVRPEDLSPADVHKSRPENVWIRDLRRESAHTVSAAFRIPPPPGLPRFAELMEVQRQAGMLQLHRQLGVSHDDVLVLASESLPMSLRGDARAWNLKALVPY